MAWFISAILDAGVATAGVVICSILVFVNVEGVFFYQRGSRRKASSTLANLGCFVNL